MELLRGATGSLSMKIAGLGVSLLFAFVVARVFGAASWGEFTLGFTYMTFGAILGCLGLDFAILKISAGIGKNDKTSISHIYSHVLLIALIFSGLISIIFFVLSGWVAAILFNMPELVKPFKISSIGILPIAVITVNTNTLQGLKKISVFAFFRYVSKNLVALIALFPLFYLVQEKENIVLIAFVTGLVAVAIGSQFWIYMSGIRIKNKVAEESQINELQNLLYKIALPLLVTGVLLFLKSWIDTLMVGVFLKEVDVGIYTIALKTAGLLSIFFVAIGNIAAPKISEIYEMGNLEQLEKLVQFSAKISVWFTLPFLVLIILFPDVILSIFGSEFSDGQYVLIILSTGVFINIVAGPVGHFLNMTESQVAYRNITFIVLLVGVAMSILLIPEFGLEGAAFANLLSLSIWNVFGIIYIKRKYGIRIFYLPFK